MVPGHGPDFSQMTDEELEKQLRFLVLESAFEMAWEEEEGEEEEDI